MFHAYIFHPRISFENFALPSCFHSILPYLVLSLFPPYPPPSHTQHHPGKKKDQVPRLETQIAKRTIQDHALDHRVNVSLYLVLDSLSLTCTDDQTIKRTSPKPNNNTKAPSPHTCPSHLLPFPSLPFTIRLPFPARRSSAPFPSQGSPPPKIQRQKED